MRREAKRTQAKAYAEGTFLNYVNQWVMFLSFCVENSLQAIPATVDTLLCYAQYLSERMKSYGSISGYLVGVKKLNSLLNLRVDSFNDFQMQIMCRGLQRSSTHVVKQAEPITPGILEEAHDYFDFNSELDVLVWCASLFAFYLLFRKSNLLPNMLWGFDGNKQLRSDLIFTGKHLVVGIQWAKNHQFSWELLTFPLPILNGSKLCPVRAANTVFKQIPAGQHAHLFAFSDGTSLTYKVFQDRLQSILARVVGKESATAYTSHAFRRGGVVFNFLCGVPIELIKVVGNWKSNAFLRYWSFPWKRG